MKRLIVAGVVLALGTGLWFGLRSLARKPAPPRFVTVPNLIGLSGEGEVRATLRKVGLQLASVRPTIRNTGPPGTVVGQIPDAGTPLPYLSSVEIVMADVRVPPRSIYSPTP